MSGHGQKLSRKQEQAITSLLAAPTIAEAAKTAKIGEWTLRRWLQDPGFLDAYRAARREVVNQAVARLQKGCSQAVECLPGIIGDKEAPASARVSAARTVLEMSIKAVEIEDLAARVEDLEAAMKERRKQG